MTRKMPRFPFAVGMRVKDLEQRKKIAAVALMLKFPVADELKSKSGHWRVGVVCSVTRSVVC